MGRKIIHISVPPAIHEFVETRVRDGDFASVSEYFRELIKHDKRRQLMAHHEELRRQKMLHYGHHHGVPLSDEFD